MNYSFEYIDIILLAMIAGFIFLRLRGILGKRTGFEGKIGEEFKEEFSKTILKKEFQKKISMKRLKMNFSKAQKLPMKL